MLFPLIGGIVGVLAGVFTLWNCGAKKRQSKRFDEAAKTLLTNLETLQSGQVHFTQDGMKIENQEIVAYSNFDYVCETSDIFLLTWSEKVIVLQKKDMIGEKSQFSSFLQSQIKNYKDLKKEL